MKASIGRHLRDQVVGYAALFLVLAGGTAYATHPGGANTIGTGDIINGGVGTADLAPGEVGLSEVRSNAVGGGKIANDTVTGADINEPGLVLRTGAFNEVGDANGPPFSSAAFCSWKNTGAPHNTAGFVRDRFGIVHLKGRVDAEDVASGCQFGFVEDRMIFALPPGFRPPRREVNSALSNFNLARVNVDGPAFAGLPAGAVSVDPPTDAADAKQWLSLDGISFRCAPSGVAGCP